MTPDELIETLERLEKESAFRSDDFGLFVSNHLPALIYALKENKRLREALGIFAEPTTSEWAVASERSETIIRNAQVIALATLRAARTDPSSPPAPMTAERLKHIRENYQRLGEAALERHCGDLLAHIDAITARVAELERERDAYKSGYENHRAQNQEAIEKMIERGERVSKLETELAAARKVEDEQIGSTLHWLSFARGCSDDDDFRHNVDLTADLLTRLSAALKEAEAKLETIRRALFPDPEHHITHHARYNLEGALADLEAGQNDPTVRRTLKRVAGQIAAAERALQTKDTTP